MYVLELAQFPCRYTKTTFKEKYSCHSCMTRPTSVNKPNHQKTTDQRVLMFNCLATFKHRVGLVYSIILHTNDTRLCMLINWINPNITANNCNVFTIQLAQFPCRCTKTTIKETHSCNFCMLDQLL